MKECFKCNRVLPLDEFYKHSRMADGHLNKCKECTRKDVHQNYDKRREQYAEYERERFHDEHRKTKTLEYQRRRRHNHPDKARAYGMVGRAVKNGTLTKQSCQFCGAPESQAHHHDYSKPLDVVWACFKCHREKFHGQVVVAQI